jgi:hypothetical protein
MLAIASSRARDPKPTDWTRPEPSWGTAARDDREANLVQALKFGS